MGAMASQITNLMTFTQPFIQAQINSFVEPTQNKVYLILSYFILKKTSKLRVTGLCAGN